MSNKSVKANPTEQIREKLRGIISQEKDSGQKSKTSFEEFSRLAKEAGKSFKTDERNNSGERYYL